MVIERGKWLFDLSEDYSQFFGKRNWYDYRFVHIEFENDVILGAYEFMFALLGLGLRVRWQHTETDDWRLIKRRVDQIE